MEPTDKPCPIDRYHYRVELLNLEQCNEYDEPLVAEEGFTTGNYLLITNLESYSTYIVYVYGENEAGNGTAVNATIITQETGKIMADSVARREVGGPRNGSVHYFTTLEGGWALVHHIE